MTLKSFVDLDTALDKVQRKNKQYAKRGIKPRKRSDTHNVPKSSQGSFDIEDKRAVAHDPSILDWEYEPVNFKEFCESKEHMNLLPKGWKEGEEGALSDKQYIDCMAILGDDPKTMFDPAVRKYVFGVLLWAKGSGKDFICSVLQAYCVYIMLCLKTPQEFFGFAKGEACDILNVGKKGQQAERVYFNKFRARMLSWKWMRDKYNIVDEGKRFHFNGKGYPTCKIGTRSAEWANKNVRAFAENSGNPDSFEGYNIVFYICDEISGWTSDKDREKAEKILSILRTSQGSRNTKSLTGLGMAISYPRQDDDIMFRLEEEAKSTNSTIYFSRGYQWEVKPKRFYSGETFRFNAGTPDDPEWFDIPKELDKDFFDGNPEKAKMMYLLKPPAVEGQYFEFLDKVDSLIVPNKQPLFKVTTSYQQSQDGHGNTIYYVKKKIVGLNTQPDPNVEYVAWIDAGESTCDASLSFGHLANVTLIEGEDRHETQAVILDDTLVWEPDNKLRRIVDIGSMTTSCIDALKYINLKAVWWDQWNSGTGVYDLRNAGIMCDKHNLTGQDYDNFKTHIYSNRFLAPDGKNYVKGVEQIKHLSRTRTGNVSPGSTKHKKDIADTWCGITTLLLGELVKVRFKAGRAPGSINISSAKTAGASSGVGAVDATKQNPFSGQMAAMGRQFISTKPVTNHSDMFPGLGSFSGRTRPMSSPRSTQQKGPASPNQSRFPRGIRI